MSENTQLAQMAKNFKQSASEQQQRTEESVRAEFEKLKSVIESESISAQNTYSRAIGSLSYQHWLFGTLSALPLLVVFLAGCGLTAWLCLSGSYAVVKTYELGKYRGRWAVCNTVPKEINNTHLCMVRDEK